MNWISSIMLRRLELHDFKSFSDATVDFPRLAVLFGPNAAGKSNLLDAIQVLSRVGTERTLADALSEPIRGYPIETFTFSESGLPGLLSSERASFSLEADLGIEDDTFRYRAKVAIAPASGRLSVVDEFLAALDKAGKPKGTPAIERVDDSLRIRRQTGGGKPRYEPVGLNYAALSDPRFGLPAYPMIERVRRELSHWRAHFLDPRVAMRSAQPPADVVDVGVLGEHIAPFLYKLKAESPKHFTAVSRTLRAIIPSIAELEVDLDKRRGTLDLLVRQDGVDYSSRIVSEGTLRVLALTAIAVNPWAGSVIALEEPENGVHPRRLELVARLLFALATQEKRQVIVTSHSPLFCDSILALGRSRPNDVGLYYVSREGRVSRVRRYTTSGPLFDPDTVGEYLSSARDDGVIEELLLRGLINA